MATLDLVDLDLMDIQEIKEMLGYLAYPDCLGFQVKKESLAPFTSQDLPDHRGSEVNLA